MQAGGPRAGQVAGAGQGFGDGNGEEQGGSGEQGGGWEFHDFTSVVEGEHGAGGKIITGTVFASKDC